MGGNSNAMGLRSSACLAYYNSEEDAVHCARKAMFTHRETSALDGGEFFTRVAFRIIHDNKTPSEAIQEVADLKTSSRFIKDKVR